MKSQFTIYEWQRHLQSRFTRRGSRREEALINSQLDRSAFFAARLVQPSKMLRAAFFLFPFSLFLLAASAQSTNDSSTATDFSAFQVIVDHNIFDPDRHGRVSYTHYESHETPTFSLAGTMSYRKGMFAFFNGTSDEYRKALQEGGKIADYTVGKITFDTIQLQSSGKTIELKVGAAMRREGNDWELREPGEWGDITATGTGSSGQTSAETSTNQPSSGEQNDVLKRLMELREKELK